jgi:hypothetical protein
MNAQRETYTITTDSSTSMQRRPVVALVTAAALALALALALVQQNASSTTASTLRIRNRQDLGTLEPSASSRRRQLGKRLRYQNVARSALPNNTEEEQPSDSIKSIKTLEHSTEEPFQQNISTIDGVRGLLSSSIPLPLGENPGIRDDVKLPTVEKLVDLGYDIELPNGQDLQDLVSGSNFTIQDGLEAWFGAIDPPTNEELQDLIESIELPTKEELQDLVSSIDLPSTKDLQGFVADFDHSSSGDLEEVLNSSDLPSAKDVNDFIAGIDLPSDKEIIDFAENLDLPAKQKLQDFLAALVDLPRDVSIETVVP